MADDGKEDAKDESDPKATPKESGYRSLARRRLTNLASALTLSTFGCLLDPSWRFFSCLLLRPCSPLMPTSLPSVLFYRQ